MKIDKIINLKKIYFLKNIFKAYVEGIYADTPANRKLGRVGMSYADYAAKIKNETKEEDKVDNSNNNEKEIDNKIRSGEKYLKSNKKNNNTTENKDKKDKIQIDHRKKRQARQIDNFFEVLDDTHKNTIAYMYAANSLDSQLAKEFYEDGKKRENPMLGKLYKVTTYKFRFGRTYKEAVKQKNPNWEVQQSKGNREEVENYKMVYFNDKGDLMFPVADFTSTSKYYMKDDDGKIKEISIKDIQSYLKPSSSLYLSGKSGNPSYKKSSGSGINYRSINVDKIYKFNAGKKTWPNENFIYKELNSVIE